MTSIAVATPSRGLVHSRTVEAVFGNLMEAGVAGHGCGGWFLSHDLPIPDSDERVAELALRSGVEAVWFIEEDVLPPTGALLASIAMLGDADVVAVDYPVGAESDAWGCAVRGAGDEVLWCGIGCTLVSRHVFERLPRPWFRTDIQFVRRDGGDWEPRPHPQPPEKRWGQQDIAFSFALRAAGMRIAVVPGMTAAQARVVEMGKPGTNHGWHEIRLMDRILRQYPGVKA